MVSNTLTYLLWLSRGVFDYRDCSFWLPCMATISDALPAVDPRLVCPSPPGATRALAGIVNQPGEFLRIRFRQEKSKGEDRATRLVGLLFRQPHRLIPRRGFFTFTVESYQEYRPPPGEISS